MLFSADPERLWLRYLFAVTLIAAAITVSHMVATQSSGISTLIAADVNKSGRQRMLSQRITHFAHLLATTTDPTERSTLKDKLDWDLDIFLTNHAGLYGRTYLSDEHRTVYDGTTAQTGLNDMVDEFAMLVGKLRMPQSTGGGTTPTEGSRETLNTLHNLATGPLLRELNTSVRYFEMAVRTLEDQNRRTSNITFGLALTLLLAEAVLIFWPAHRAILTAFKDLRQEQARSKQAHLAALQASKDREHALLDKTRIFARLSYDLRTPLSDIVAGAEVLKATALNGADQEIVATIEAAGAELTRKIDILVDTSSTIDAPDVKKEAVEFTLAKVVTPLVSRAQDTATRANLGFDFRSEIDLEQSVIGDQDMFQTALSVALDRAFKATTTGEVVLTITEMAQDSKKTVVMVVEDSSTTRPKPGRDNRFGEEFSTQPKKPSYGADTTPPTLFAMQQRLKKIGGSISIGQRRTGGTRVTIVIPVAPVENVTDTKIPS